MKIEDLEGKNAYITSRSITMKDENGKTRGIVRDIKTYHTLQVRELFDWNTKFKKFHIALNNSYIVKNLVIVNNEPYYLHDLKKDEFYQEHCIDRPDIFETEIRHYNEEHELLEHVKTAGIKIVNCYIKRSSV